MRAVFLAIVLLLGHCLEAKVLQVENKTGGDTLTVKQRHSLIDSIVVNAIRNQAFPGCQIYAFRGGTVLMDTSYGYHTYDSLVKVEKDHLYDLASITKVTASMLALMKMHDDGLLDLDASLGTYFPSLKRSNKKNITVRKALSHQGRIKPWIPYHRTFRKRNGDFRKGTISNDSSAQFPVRISENHFIGTEIKGKIKKAIARSELNNEERYAYSGLIFYLIPDLVERTYGMSFEEFLRQYFYEPLSAESIGFKPLANFSKTEIVPTEVDDFFRNELIHGLVHDEGAILMNGVSGNAGLFGNAKDLAKIWLMLLNYGSYQNKSYITPETVMKFTSCQYCEKGNRRGLGFDKPLIEFDSVKSSVAEQSSKWSFGHTGYTGTLVWADPQNDLIFIFLSNRVYPSRDNKKIYQLNVRPSIHEILYEN